MYQPEIVPSLRRIEDKLDAALRRPEETAVSTRQWLARHSTTGQLYQIGARDEDAAYRAFAKAVLGSEQQDTGNVDIDLFEIGHLGESRVILLEGE